eukprot:scaffold9442_cov117-Isochrysis_galbana.AAC.8
MLYEATSSGPSPGKPRVASKTRAAARTLVGRRAWCVLVEALFAVGAEALDGRVGLEVALDRAHAFAVGVVLPRAGEVVERGALLALLLVEEANAISAKRWLGLGGGSPRASRMLKFWVSVRRTLRLLYCSLSKAHEQMRTL